MSKQTKQNEIIINDVVSWCNGSSISECVEAVKWISNSQFCELMKCFNENPKDGFGDNLRNVLITLTNFRTFHDASLDALVKTKQ